MQRSQQTKARFTRLCQIGPLFVVAVSLSVDIDRFSEKRVLTSSAQPVQSRRNGLGAYPLCCRGII